MGSLRSPIGELPVVVALESSGGLRDPQSSSDMIADVDAITCDVKSILNHDKADIYREGMVYDKPYNVILEG